MLKIIDRYDSFALLIIKNMVVGTANNLANINGIEFLTQLYLKSKNAVFVNLIRSILMQQTTDKFVDVNSLFRLADLSPQLLDLALQKLVDVSKNKTKGTEFENYIPKLFEMLDPVVSGRPEKTRLLSLHILSNLSLKDNLRNVIS